MKKILDYSAQGGRLRIYTDEKNFIVVPSGIINPILVKKDIELATEYGKKHKDWNYIVDTSRVLFPNPLNLVYLKEIKRLMNRRKYIIYAPSLAVRFFGYLTRFIIKPDEIISTKEDFRFSELTKSS